MTSGMNKRYLCFLMAVILVAAPMLFSLHMKVAYSQGDENPIEWEGEFLTIDNITEHSADIEWDQATDQTEITEYIIFVEIENGSSMGPYSVTSDVYTEKYQFTLENLPEESYVMVSVEAKMTSDLVSTNGPTGAFYTLSPEISIPDPKLREAFEQEIGLQPGDPITKAMMRELYHFYVEDIGIENLQGLEHAVNLRELTIIGNQISDWSVLSALQHLYMLSIDGSTFTHEDLFHLAYLSELTTIDLSFNQISDLTPLMKMLEEGHLELPAPLIMLYGNPLDLTEGSTTYQQWLELLTSGVWVFTESIFDPIFDELELVYATHMTGTELTFHWKNELFFGLPFGDLQLYINDEPWGEMVNAELEQVKVTGLVPGETYTFKLGLLIMEDTLLPLNVQKTVTMASHDTVHIPDPGLKEAILAALDKPVGAAVSQIEISTLKELNAAGRGIQDLTGLEFATSLEVLDLSHNDLNDDSGWEKLDQLKWTLHTLHVANNDLNHLDFLAGYEWLDVLDVSHNRIYELSSLDHKFLSALNVSGNRISSLKSLDESALAWSGATLNLSNNYIVDVVAETQRFAHINIIDESLEPGQPSQRTDAVQWGTGANVSIVKRTHSSALLSWNGHSDADTYVIYVNGYPIVTEQPIVDTEFTLDGLDPATQYTVKIEANKAGLQSVSGPSIRFATSVSVPFYMRSSHSVLSEGDTFTVDVYTTPIFDYWQSYEINLQYDKELLEVVKGGGDPATGYYPYYYYQYRSPDTAYYSFTDDENGEISFQGAATLGEVAMLPPIIGVARFEFKVKSSAQVPAVITLREGSGIWGKDLDGEKLHTSLAEDVSLILPTLGDPVPATSLEFTKSRVALDPEHRKTEQLELTYSPSYAQLGQLSWHSSNPSVATVNAQGEVTAVGEGNAIISVSDSYSGLTASVPVRVGTIVRVAWDEHSWVQEELPEVGVEAFREGGIGPDPTPLDFIDEYGEAVLVGLKPGMYKLSLLQIRNPNELDGSMPIIPSKVQWIEVQEDVRPSPALLRVIPLKRPFADPYEKVNVADVLYIIEGVRTFGWDFYGIDAEAHFPGILLHKIDSVIFPS